MVSAAIGPKLDPSFCQSVLLFPDWPQSDRNSEKHTALGLKELMAGRLNKDSTPELYSQRRAITGLTRVARRAGM